MKEKTKKKSFCKWDKEDIKKNLDAIYDPTAAPKYVCQKCARVSRRKANVCNPHAFGTQG